MKIIDTLEVDHLGKDTRTLVLCSGTIASIPPDIQLQYLVISGSPGGFHWQPNPHVKELEHLGIELEALEQTTCRHDFRPSLPCWVSESLNFPGINFQYLLSWAPVMAPEAKYRLEQVHLAFQALARLEGFSGGRSAMFVLWPTVGEETEQDVLRMQFFSAVAMAARSPWETLYLMVTDEQADAATGWFATFKEGYADPPISIEALPDAPGGSARPGSRKDPPPNDGRVTDRQHRAIYEYTRLAYASVNPVLRTNDLRSPDYVVMHPYIEALSTGLSMLPNHEGAGERVYRAYNIHTIPDNFYRDGYDAHDTTFCSFSIRQLGIRPHHLKMHSSLGKHIQMYSDFPDEQEVLFDRDLRLVVTGIRSLPPPYTQEVLAHERLPSYIGVRDTHL